MDKISVVIITLNEQDNLEACLESVKWADEIVIVDGESVDQTRKIASRYTNTVCVRKFDNFSNQKNFGCEKASGEWIFSIDADEVVTKELRDSILNVVCNGTDFSGFYVTRINYIFGKHFRFGGQGPEKILRLFRKNKGKFIQPIHEKVQVDGSVGELKGELIHHSIPTVRDYFKKMKLYIDFEAKWLLEQNVRPSLIKLYLQPLLRFIYVYFIKLGFLDGYQGLLFYSFSSYYYHLKYKRLQELRN